MATIKKNKPIMTDRQYVNVSGQLCPVCRSGDALEGGGVEIDDGEATQEVTCSNCCSTWTDVYNLVGFCDCMYPGKEEENDGNK